MYDNIINLENLYKAWREFQNGKRNKNDVAIFSRNLDVHLYNLHNDLKNKIYKHGGYKEFKINDPKPRDIHKAPVRDRLLHHAIYRILYPYFDKKFIYDSYSCRVDKGAHRAIERFEVFARKASKNNTKTCWILKCDIRKFFANIDHDILKSILTKHIQDIDTLALLSNIINSFCTRQDLVQKDVFTNSNPWVSNSKDEKGLPLGNLTSQLLVNIYMNEFDQFVKHKLKVEYYIRYADDFVILSEDREYLTKLLPVISEFIKNYLKLQLHPDKVYIKNLSSGLDFLGWVHFPKHRVLRTATKKRMFRNLKKNNFKEQSVNSYLGMLKWGNGHRLKYEILAKLG
ncbi:MAG: group II intron reverse transcriptase domain-containing protein [Candidatus Pacebacteria bacterium]|nr:group II intron reverse transcriptase domain-containing protein [Candidatus Paceibacterota bacterium]MBP9716208.1 group II intron reverse transcriptase domain-containing protein [Candidatus Paceibacterota bacterium]